MIAQVVLYDADFTIDDQGFPDHSNSNPPASGPQSASGGVAPNSWNVSYLTAPSTDGGGNIYSTNGGVMEIRDWGGEASFESQSIDVSAYSSVNITFTGAWVGGGANVASEFFRYTYTDNTGTNTINTSNSADMNVTLTNVDVSSISSMFLGFEFNQNGGSDGFDITSMIVEEYVAPLPVALTAFNAKLTNTGAMLEWTTASEENNDYFAVEMSRDAARFSESAKINGNGTTESLETYTYEYSNLTPGTYYFRLRQVDFDGQYSYSDVVSLTVEGDRDFLMVSNTVTDFIEIDVTNPRPARVLNLAGAVVAEFALTEGRNNLDISSLAQGMYILSDGINAKRFVK